MKRSSWWFIGWLATCWICAAAQAQSGAPTQAEINSLMAKQLPAHLELVEVTQMSAKQQGNAMLQALTAELAVQARAREPLYLPDGTQDGKQRLAISRLVGETVEMGAVLIAVIPSGNVAQRNVQVMLKPGKQPAGNPLSSYARGTYVLPNAGAVSASSAGGNAKPTAVAAPAAAVPIATETTATTPAAPVSKPALNADDASSCIAIGTQLWNLKTRELVSRQWPGHEVRPIANMPGRYLISMGGGRVHYPAGGLHRMLSFDTITNKSFDPLSAVSLDDINNNRIWLAFDRRAAVQLKQGDLWRSDIDWQQGRMKPPVNLTQIGLLAQSEPVLWYGDHLWMRRKEATTKPIVKINIRTGAIEEFAETAPFKGPYGSPNGRFKYWGDHHEGKLHVFDAKIGETFSMEATRVYRMYGGAVKERPTPVNIDDQVYWVNEDTFYTHINFTWVDLAKREITQVVTLPKIVADVPAQIGGANPISWIPGADYIDQTFTGQRADDNGGIIPNSGIKRRYRIGRLTREVIDLPSEDADVGVTWLDANRYVVARDKGGLNEVGTWLYDVRTNKHVRISRFVSAVGAVNSLALPGQVPEVMTPDRRHEHYLNLSDQNKIGFGVNRGGRYEYHIQPLDGSEPWVIELPQVQSGASLGATRVLNLPVNLQ